jgi:FixJ family two-component response regulator
VTEPSPTVFVVDDDAAVRDAVCLLLKSVSLRAEAFPSAAGFLDAYDAERPGCLILDIRMEGMSGLELHRELIARHSILPVIFVTGHGDIAMAVQAMQDGAFDFVEKPFRDQDLLDRVRKALHLDASSRADLLRREEIRRRMQDLTPREREVLGHVIAGSPNKAIAYDLAISERTVEVHRARVMEKMKAASLAHLVRMVFETEG